MYAYPQRPGAGGPPPPTAFAQPPPVYVPPPPPVAASNPALYSVPSGSVTTLRLKVSEEIRIEAPVAVSAALLPSSSAPATPSLDLALERKLVEEGTQSEGGAGTSGASASGSISSSSKGDVDAFLSGIKTGELPQDPAIKKVIAMGVSPAPAALGVIYARAGRGGPDKAADFARKCGQLTAEMGFSLALAAGALARHKGDLEAATEACLATSAS